MTSTIIAFDTTTTLIFSTLTSHVQLLVIIGLVLIVLGLVDFIRRFLMFGKR